MNRQDASQIRKSFRLVQHKYIQRGQRVLEYVIGQIIRHLFQLKQNNFDI